VEKITPNCRYGHGDLEICVNHGISPGDWFASFSTISTGQAHFGATFIYRLYKCKVCTYLEMHDLPTEEFERVKHAAIAAQHEQQVAAAQQALEAAQKAAESDLSGGDDANKH
jgi:hypothetical protein